MSLSPKNSGQITAPLKSATTSPALADPCRKTPLPALGMLSRQHVRVHAASLVRGNDSLGARYLRLRARLTRRD